MNKLSKKVIPICLSLFVAAGGLAGRILYVKADKTQNIQHDKTVNTQPTASFQVAKKKKVDVVLRVGSISDSESSFLQGNAVQYIKDQLNGRGIDVNIPSSDFTSQKIEDINIKQNASDVSAESKIIGFHLYNNYGVPMVYTKEGFADITTDDNQALLYPSSIGNPASTSRIQVRSSAYTGELSVTSFSVQPDNSIIANTNSSNFQIKYSISEMKYVKIEILTNGTGNFDAQIYYDTDVSGMDYVPVYSTSNGWYIYNSVTNTKAVGIAHNDNRVTNATAVSLERYGSSSSIGRSGFNSSYDDEDSAVVQYYAGHNMGETISTLIGIERPTQEMYKVKASIIADGLKNVNWNSDNRFTVIFNNKDYSDLDNSATKSQIASFASTNNTEMIFSGNSSMPYSQSQQLGKLVNAGYDIINNDSQIQQLQAIVDYIAKEVNSKYNSNSNIFLVGDELDYKETYKDRENDQKKDELWRYDHDEKHFNYDDDFVKCSQTGDINCDNNLGHEDFSGNWIKSKITSFYKPGKYKISYKVQDNPTSPIGEIPVKGKSSFNNYNLWSPDDNSIIINVHRKPTPVFTAYATANSYTGMFDTSINYRNADGSLMSYDADHQLTDGTRKGIVNYKFAYKDVDSANWTDGMIPSSLPKDHDYLIKMAVQDLEGQWSDDSVKYITTKNENLPPVAQFIESETEMPVDQLNNYASAGKDVVFTDRSYDPNGDSIEEHWTVKDSNGNTIYDSSVMPTAAAFIGKPLGTYSITLVCDDGPTPKVGVPLTSEPYTLQLKLVPINHKPIAHFEIDNTSREPQNIKINEDSYDPDGDPVDVRHWFVTDMNGKLVQDSGSSLPNFNQLDGTYKVGLIVKDNPKIPPELWSDPYYQTVTIENLKLNASLSPNPAQQGQQIIFDINTTGYAKYLRVFIPGEISSLDKRGTQFPLAKVITEEYKHNEKMKYILPINTPLTIDRNGSRIRQPYQIPVVSEKANGDKQSVTLLLDVKGSVLDGIKTEIIGTGQDRDN